MKTKFSDYLKEVGINGQFLKRVDGIISFYSSIYTDSIQEIFVSEYRTQNGKREYESFWLFTSKFACEAKQFLTEDNFDTTPIAKKIKYWELKKTKYDLNTSTDESRMVVEFLMGTEISGSLKASKKNCEHLYKIFKEFIVPNIIE